MNWIIIAALIVLAFFSLRIKHMRHKIFLVFLIIILLFIYTTGSSILSEEEIDWKSVGGVEKALTLYFSWLGGAFDNIKVITGDAIKMDWNPENSTKISEVE